MNSTEGHELAAINQAGEASTSPPALRHMVAEARAKAVAETRAGERFGRASAAMQTAITAGNMSIATVEVLVSYIEELEHRFSQRPALSYTGVYVPGREYVPHESTTWGGNLYVAMETTNKKPDSPESGWKLAVRRGRDARNVRP